MALIEREALLKAHKPSMGFLSVRKMIEEAPAIDAAPVVHGLWTPGEDEDPEEADYDHYNWTCSACHEEICYIDPTPQKHLPRYCPNCGARMDGGEEHG